MDLDLVRERLRALVMAARLRGSLGSVPSVNNEIALDAIQAERDLFEEVYAMIASEFEPPVQEVRRG